MAQCKTNGRRIDELKFFCSLDTKTQGSFDNQL